MTIGQLGKQLELFPLPARRDEGPCAEMLDCPVESNCGRDMALILRKAALLKYACKRTTGPDKRLDGIAEAAWFTCSVLFYG